MSEKGSTSDVKNAMEGDSKRTRDQVGQDINAVLSNATLHAFHDIQCNMSSIHRISQKFGHIYFNVCFS